MCRRRPRTISPTNSLQTQGMLVDSWISEPSLASDTPSWNLGFLPGLPLTCAQQLLPQRASPCAALPPQAGRRHHRLSISRRDYGQEEARTGYLHEGEMCCNWNLIQSGEAYE